MVGTKKEINPGGGPEWNNEKLLEKQISLSQDSKAGIQGFHLFTLLMSLTKLK